MGAIVSRRALQLIGLPIVGWLASVAVVLLGPLDFWGGYFLMGAIWALTFPFRIVIREWAPDLGQNSATYFIQDLEDRWYEVVEEGVLAGVLTVLGIIVIVTLAWPLTVLFGAYLFSQIYR